MRLADSSPKLNREGALFHRWLFLSAFCLLLLRVDAQQAGPHIPLERRPSAPTDTVEQRETIEPIAPGKFRIGWIDLDQKQREVSFPATLNMTNGVVEYAIVNEAGKVHESVLRTEAQPYQIHLAMLLLGVNSTNIPSAMNTNGPAPATTQIDVPGPADLTGDKIAIEVRWNAEGKEIRRPLSELVFNSRANKALAGEPWVYSGSRFGQGRFLAQLSGSIVSLITDLDALINSTSPGHEDDEIWQVNPKAIPPPRMPLEIILRLPAKR